MANEVKWIHIASDIFDDEKMYAIETQQDGYLLELVWFKILCLAGKCNENGFLTINNKVAYTNEMLAKVFRLEIGTVQRALELFQTLGMIEVFDNAYMISNWTKYQNTEGLEHIKEQNRIRQQNYRDRQKQLKIESNVTDNVTNNVTDNVKSNVNCSISISKVLVNSKEENINTINNIKKNVKHKHGEYQHVKLTDDEYQRLLADFGEGKLKKCIQILDEYCEQSGKTYKNYNLVLRGWVQNEFKKRYPCFEPNDVKDNRPSADEIRKFAMGES